MKILHLINRFDYCDGCSRHVYLLASAQHQAGHDVHVLAGRGNAFELLTKEMIPIEIERSLSHDDRSVPAFVRGIYKMRHYLKRYQPDIVHSHHYYAANLVALASWFIPVKTVLTVHSNYSSIGRLTKYMGDKIIAVSYSTRENILSQKDSVRDAIIVIHNGSELIHGPDELHTVQEIQTLQKLKPHKFVVTFAGRISKMKGVHVLLAAVHRLHLEIPILCVIAGTGDFEESLKSEYGGNSSAFLWLGSVLDLKPILELTDVVCIPSISSEGLPMVLLEAGLMARAVVASRLGGIAEVIDDERTGLIVTPGNEDELVNALQRLYTDARMRISLGKELQLKVCREFTVSAMVSSVEAVYESLLRQE